MRRVHAASLTPADRVTLVRVGLLGVVVALLLARGGLGPEVWGWLTVAVAAPMLLLDAVDGAVARRTQATEHGAQFDMEADAAAVLVLSVAAGLAVGPWIVLAGLLRYLFVVAGAALPALRRPLPFSQARRVVAAVQGPALLVAILPGVPVGWASAVCAASLTLLLWSFGRDVVGQLAGAPRHRGAGPVQRLVRPVQE